MVWLPNVKKKLEIGTIGKYILHMWQRTGYQKM